MKERSQEPVLVVLQLSGGNDFMNTLIPYTSGAYYDARPTVAIPQKDVLPIDDTLGFHPSAGPLKELYDRGKMAIVQGIGYPNSIRSHFRAMDIWHTCEPHEVGTEGWVAKAIRELDPRSENVLTCVSLGKGLPRAVVASGVPVTSVDNLEAYGVMTGIAEEERLEALEIFKHMYTPAVGAQAAMGYLGNTGLDVLKGTDMLKKAPAEYESGIEYANNGIAKSLRDVARIHLAGLGTRIFYTQHGGYDTHSRELLAPQSAVDGAFRGHHGLLPGFGGARRRRQRSHARVHGIRPTDQGQRQRHGPRLWRRGVHHRTSRQGRPVRGVSACGPGQLVERRGSAPHGGFPGRLRDHA